MTPDPVRGYSAAQIVLHWTIAAIVVVQLLIGDSMSAFLRSTAPGAAPVSPRTAELAGVHYYFGVAVLALVAVRLALRIGRGAPPPPETSPALRRAAGITHGLFYALLVVVPITGLLGYYLGDPYGELHELSKPAFVILIALHVAASLYHQFWLKDGLITRMLRPE